MAYDPKLVGGVIAQIRQMAEGMTNKQADEFKEKIGIAFGAAYADRSKADAARRHVAMTERFEHFLIGRRFASVNELAEHLFDEVTAYAKQRTYSILNPLYNEGRVARFKARDAEGNKLGPRWRHIDSKKPLDEEGLHEKLFPKPKRRRSI